MSKIPNNLYYTESHEWLGMDATYTDHAEDEAVYTLGITDYAQQNLGDVVFVELPETGTTQEKTKEIAVVESVKSASDIYMPVAGTIVAINDTLPDQPELINNEPYASGWMVKIKAKTADVAQLLKAEEYAKLIQA